MKTPGICSSNAQLAAHLPEGISTQTKAVWRSGCLKPDRFDSSTWRSRSSEQRYLWSYDWVSSVSSCLSSGRLECSPGSCKELRPAQSWTVWPSCYWLGAGAWSWRQEIWTRLGFSRLESPSSLNRSRWRHYLGSLARLSCLWLSGKEYLHQNGRLFSHHVHASRVQRISLKVWSRWCWSCGNGVRGPSWAWTSCLGGVGKVSEPRVSLTRRVQAWRPLSLYIFCKF